MIQTTTLLTIVLMGMATYLTRIGGYLLLRNRQLSERAQTVMDAAPGCVLLAVIAPHFVSGHPADLAALGITLLAAWRLPLLATVVIAIASAGLFRLIFT